jgi:hypothetical protein
MRNAVNMVGKIGETMAVMVSSWPRDSFQRAGSGAKPGPGADMLSRNDRKRRSR